MAPGTDLAGALEALDAASGHPRFFLGSEAAWRSGVGAARRLEAPDLAWLAAAAPERAFVAFAFDPNRCWPRFPAALAVEAALLDPNVAEVRALPPPAPRAATPSLHLAAMDRAGWDAAFARIMAEVQAGRLGKAVLARCAHAAAANPVALLRRLLEREPGSAAFLFEPEPGLALVGATPETLVRLEGGGVASTHALAGTARHGGQEPPPAEHDLVVADIAARLAPFGTVTVGRPTKRRLRAVVHDETPVEVTLRQPATALELAAALHPTPAVGGVPRDAAVRLVAELEPAPRGWYSGGVGWLGSGGTGTLHVALRCALVADRTYAFAGAGIVAGSSADAEWHETEAKLRTILEALP